MPDLQPDTYALVTNPRIIFDDTDLTIWQVWADCWKKRGVRAFLTELATGNYDTIIDPMRKLYPKAQDKGLYTRLHKWHQSIPGLKEVETKFLTDPATCAQFLAVRYLPYALAYWGKVLNGEEKGNKAVAARFVTHMADPTLRVTTAIKEAPLPPGKPEGSKLEEMVKAVGLREVERAEKEMDEDE